MPGGRYENEGKTTIRSEGSEKVATRLLCVVADLCSIPANDTTRFELMSELGRPHGYAVQRDERWGGLCD